MHKKLGFLFLIVYWIVESEPFKPTIVYVNDGVNTTLNCDVDNYSASSWFGPCLSHNNRCSPKIPYYDGLIRDPMISSSISLQTSKGQEEGSYNLHISNVTSKNKGDYKCLGFKGKSIQIKRYELKLKVKPSNISIDNISFDGSIIGTEGKDLELVCSVISGVPKENMSWYRGLSLVKTGGPGNISYSFVPKRDDHGRTFSCAVQNEVLKKPLNKKVTLNIKYLPVVQTPARTQSVSIGNNFTLQCLSEGNPPAYLMRIRNKRTILKSCNNFTCSLTLISSRKNSGNYTCEAQNELGIVNETASVKVLYPPNVTISTTNNCELRCNADGEPKNTSFVAWRYVSEQGTLLRLFKGSANLTLCSSCKTYEVNGLYICQVTNGIPGSDGKKVTFGEKIIKLQGIPEILPSTKESQYGKYMESVSIKIDIYSIPEITSRKILRNDKVIDELLLLKQTSVSVGIHGKTVMITGYTISKIIKSVQESDFTNYTFVISNAKGSVNFTVILKAQDVPNIPYIEVVSVGDTHIAVMIRRNFNGGSEQTFFVEYKPFIANHWNCFAVINDTFGNNTTLRIHNLEYDTEYCVQIYSRNSIGGSNTTTKCSIRTNAKAWSVLMYIVVVISALVVLTITTMIFRKGVVVGKFFVRNVNDQEDNVGENQEQVIEVAVENQAYLSFDSLPRMLPINGNQNANRNVLFKRRNCLEDHKLNYVELEFNEASQAFHIRGEDRTIYADIDHKLTASPLESSESEEEKDNNEDEDDFVTLEDIAEFMNEKGITPLHE